MKILALYRDNSSCDYHRIYLPFINFPISLEDSLKMKTPSDEISEEDFDVDFVIWNRTCPYDDDTILQLRDKYKFKIIMDIDDYWILNVGHEAYESWMKNDMVNRLITTISYADYIWTTTELLAGKLLKLNEDVHIFPNSLPFDEDQFTTAPISDNIRFVYTGGRSHYRDFKTILQAIQKSKCTVMVAGFSYENVDYWIRMQNLLRGCNYALINQLPHESYMDAYNYGEVALAPLEVNSFTESKSPLKIIEAGCKNMPIICSNTSPYKEFDGVAGVYLCKNTKDWYSTMKHLEKNPQEVISNGEKLGSFVRNNFNLHSVNKDRYKFLKDVSS